MYFHTFSRPILFSQLIYHILFGLRPVEFLLVQLVLGVDYHDGGLGLESPHQVGHLVLQVGGGDQG